MARSIAPEALREAASALRPDEVWVLPAGEIPAPVARRHPGAPVLAVWRD